MFFTAICINETESSKSTFSADLNAQTITNLILEYNGPVRLKVKKKPINTLSLFICSIFLMTENVYILIAEA